MNDAAQLCHIGKHSKPLASFRHQRFQHQTTSSCLDCRTGSICTTLSQRPPPPLADTSPPTAQDPVATTSSPSQDSTAPTTVPPPLPPPSMSVPPTLPAYPSAVPLPTPAPSAPAQTFVTCTDLSASIGELRQFLQDEFADILQRVASTPPSAQPLLPAPFLQPQPSPALPAEIGEYQSDITFPWLSGDLIDKIHQDTLSVYDLPKLANPSWPGAPALEDNALVLIEGFSVVKGQSTSTSNRQFIKAVPSFSTFGRLWVVYLSLRSSSSHDCDLPVSLGCFYQHVADLSEVFPRTESPAMSLLSAHLVLAGPTPPSGLVSTPSCMPPTSKECQHDLPPLPASNDPPPASTILDVTRFASLGTKVVALELTSGLASANICVSPVEGSTHPRRAPVAPLPMDPLPNRLWPTDLPPPWLSQAVPAALRDDSPVPTGSILDITTPLLVPPTAIALHQLIPLQTLQTLQPPAHPNTTLNAPLYPDSGIPARHGTMQATVAHWHQALLHYPDRLFVAQLLGAITHGVHLGYAGPLRRLGRFANPKNLPMDHKGETHVQVEIATHLLEGRLVEVDPRACNLVCSPIGVVLKPHLSKLRTIHHLSHPRLPRPDQMPSVNDGIAPHFTSIRYASLANILAFIWENPGCRLWKSDLTDAFRHIVTTLANARLLGFSYAGRYYMETGLTFGGCSSPWLFNLFAEALHWVLQSTTPNPVNHYLDDFFGAVPADTDPGQPLHALALACSALGLQLAPLKTFWAATKLEILGIQIDTIQQSISITSERRSRILDAANILLTRCSARLHDWQCIAGLLQFVSQVVLHGKAYLRRLYDASKAAHQHPLCLRPISQPATDELRWWQSTLQSWAGHSLLQPSPLLIEHIWTDASKHGYGAHLGLMRSPTAAFSWEVN
ncbi:uncharacterized protein UHO2_00419 [Ustilago hordei]|uniref:uncharacterized protein n=1 Tax=Ustilago hordei TaxID=120017 RepID=UPI001A4FCADD|nr:uncharacterized protein UHO2_00419 [Ustilago hordei]SYW81930.1 uncharacterized protein UHO2_00419 [Ustilago hordei]